MNETPEERRAKWDAYIASHEKVARDLRAARQIPEPTALLSGLASLHEAVAALSVQIRDGANQPADPHHPEYHKVRQTHLYASADQRFASAASFAQLAARSVLIAHGGALVALLTFLGQSRIQLTGCTVWLVFFSFVAGLICSLLAVLFAYETQSCYARQDEAGADKIYFGLLGQTEQENREEQIETEQMAKGRRWEILAVVAFLVALALFVGGSIAGVWMLTHLPAPIT